MKSKPTPEKSTAREGERGAALITALLISTLLLLAGGALLVKTTGAVAVSFGSTAEMQAYYNAEAGSSRPSRPARNVPNEPATRPPSPRP